MQGSTDMAREANMSEQNETSIHVLPTAVAVEVVAVPLAADCLYQFAALTAGFLLLVTLL
jgi:hypothetical protein